MHFVVDVFSFFFALIFFFCFLLLRFFFRNYPEPKFLYSYLKNLQLPIAAKASYLSGLPQKFYFLGWSFFLLAFIDPRIDSFKKKEYQENEQLLSHEGLAIYLVLDQSGSMGGHIIHEISEENVQFPTKLELLKAMSQQFIKQRKGDMIGLVAFSRTAQVLVPLTLDHEALLKSLKELQVESRTNQNATAIGYAIYKTALLISATRDFAKKNSNEGEVAYDIKGGVMILITDGFQNPHPEDKGNALRSIGLEEAAQKAQSENIHLYIISIEPSINESRYEAHRNLMQRSAEVTGGQFFTAENPNVLPDIFKRINSLEKSSFQMDLSDNSRIYIRYFSFYPYLIFAGLISVTVAIICQTVLFRKAP